MFERLRAMFAPAAPPVAATTAPVRTGPGPGGRSIRAQAAYEAGTPPTNRRAAGWSTSEPGPIAATIQNAAAIRARARHAWRNDALARQIAETWVSECVGWGPVPRPLARDAATRNRLSADWAEWSERVASDGSDFATLVATVVRGVVVDGEAFVRLRARRPEDRLVVPLQLEVIDPGRVPFTTQDLPAGGRIVGGVEFDAIGRVVAFHVNDHSPGDPIPAGASPTPRRIPADQVLHVADLALPGQVRGVSMLATSLLKLRQIDLLADAVLMRTQVANLFAGFVERPAGLGSAESHLNALTGAEEDTDSLGRELVALEPGIVQELAPGEKLEFNDPPAPPAVDGFLLEQMRLAAMGAGVPLEVLTGDWRGANDRVARVVLHGWRRRVEQFRWSVLTPRLLRPVWNAWLKASGISQPSEDEGWQRAAWRHHAWPYIHPVQDVNATVAAIRSGLTSLSAAIAEASGEDAEAVLSAIAEDNRRADALGLALDSDPRQRGAQ